MSRFHGQEEATAGITKIQTDAIEDEMTEL
jgi:hypothetical protein